MNIPVTIDNMSILECFSTESRVRIIELLSHNPHSISELAERLGLSSAIITRHIQKLEDAGLVRTESIAGTRGRRKVCHLQHDELTLILKNPSIAPTETNHYHVSIPVGQYSRYAVKPTCGLASETGIIGMQDDPRYFSNPEHVKARHVWFASGYIEYRIPNYLVGTQQAKELTITLEICSEAPGFNENWPSDISFYLNDIEIGTWTCPGDFGRVRGILTPAWWTNGTQHGLLKTLTVRPDGSYLDGVRLSTVTPAQLDIAIGQDIGFKISCPDTAEHCGGVSLFGRRFGNYDQDIEVTIHV